MEEVNNNIEVPVEANSEPKVNANRKLIRQKSFGRKTVRALFSGESITDIVKYVITDVAVPAVRDLLYDMADRGIERLLYGDGKVPRGANKRPTGSYTSYGSMSRSTDSRRDNRDSGRPFVKPENHTRFEDDIFFETIPSGTEMYPNGANGRANAELVRDIMCDRISKYGHATVAELMSEIKELYPDIALPTHGFTDGYYGWTNFSTTRIVPTRGGVLMMLPKCEQLE